MPMGKVQSMYVSKHTDDKRGNRTASLVLLSMLVVINTALSCPAAEDYSGESQESEANRAEQILKGLMTSPSDLQSDITIHGLLGDAYAAQGLQNEAAREYLAAVDLAEQKLRSEAQRPASELSQLFSIAKARHLSKAVLKE